MLQLFDYRITSNEKKKFSFQDVLYYLGLRSFTSGQSFMSERDFISQFKESDNVLISERFRSSISISSGAGRHALTNNLQIKGIGRNSLANQIDYAHSWGGFLPIDGLKSLLADKICESRTLNTPLKTIGLFLYADPSIMPKQILAFRENHSYRLSTFWPDVLNNSLRKIARETLEKKFDKYDCTAINDFLIEQYIHAASKGVLHRTPVPDNLTLTGEWIDTESIDFTEVNSEINPYLFVFVEGNLNFTVQSLKEILHLRDIKLTGSSLHDMALPGKLSSIVLDGIFKEKMTVDFLEIFKEKLELHFNNHKDLFFLYEKYKCIKSLSLENESYDSLPALDYKDIEFAQDYKCAGQFYDIRYNGTLLYFTSGEDISLQTKRILEKLNLALSKDDLTFESAFKKAKILNLIH